jgi:hypothetical protein
MAASPDPGRPEEVHDAVAHASLRLLAGAVPKATMDRLRRDAKASGAEYPWEAATRALLADPAEPGQLVQRGLAAQRDWILRGGRETPGPGLAARTKGLFARLAAQLVFGLLYAVVVVVGLIVLKHIRPSLDIYIAVPWLEAAVEWVRRLAGG